MQNIARHCMLPGAGAAETNLGIAVSGGADSVCLLEILTGLAEALHLRLSVVHLNHQLRGADSDSDASFVAALAEARGLPLHPRNCDVREAARESGDNLEQAARAARYSFFRELVSSGAVERIATGHNREDQSETVLFRILRGCGLTGLAGILPVTAEGIIRPLLPLTRREIREFLQERGIEWREDSTNRDVSLARNRLRHEVMPSLRREFNPQLDEALASLARLAREEEEFWRKEAPLPSLQNGTVLLKTNELTDVPAALARRRIRSAILAVKGDLRQIDLAHVDRILDMAHHRKGSDRAQIPGVDVFRSFDWLRFAPSRYDSMRGRNFRVGVTVPGSAKLPNGTEISLEVLGETTQRADCARVRMDLDWPKVLGLRELDGADWELRNWRPGDHYQPVQYIGDRKLKQLFQEHRIPLWERRNWPVLVYRERILWSRRFGPAADLAASAESKLIMRIREGFISRA